MDYVYKEVTSLWKAFNKRPFFGLDCEALTKAGTDMLASQRVFSQ